MCEGVASEVARRARVRHSVGYWADGKDLSIDIRLGDANDYSEVAVRRVDGKYTVAGQPCEASSLRETIEMTCEVTLCKRLNSGKTNI